VPGRVAESVDKGHGRIEKRTMRTTTTLTLHQKWEGMKQGFEIKRERTIGGVTTIEVGYGITSLSEKEADAARLLALTRMHWRIENGLHYVRDVTMGEDASRVRKGNAPQVLAALRNLVIFVVGQEADAKETRPEVMERMAARPAEALQALDLPLLQ
jgi:predicted transposase YbfD/YdcC